MMRSSVYHSAQSGAEWIWLVRVKVFIRYTPATLNLYIRHLLVDANRLILNVSVDGRVCVLRRDGLCCSAQPAFDKNYIV